MVSVDFALGFIAGEGCFSLVKKNYGKEKLYCIPQFQLGVDPTDAYVVQEVRETFGGIGSVYESENEFKWTVNSKEDMLKMCSVINDHDNGPWLASKKREAFKSWEKIVEIHVNGASTDQDRVNMAHIAQNESLNVGSGGSDAEWGSFIDWYAENRNTYPEVGRME